jgi:uncharacterized protein YndB with AHSA1/START domain
VRSITKSIDVAASPSTVYEFVTEPANLPHVWPSLVSVSNVERSPDGSHSFEWTYKLGGLCLRGRAASVRAERNAFVEVDNERGVPSRFRWRCVPRGGETRVTLEADYEIPASIIGRLAEPIVAKMNEREMDQLLSNVKLAVERGPAPGAQAEHA